MQARTTAGEPNILTAHLFRSAGRIFGVTLDESGRNLPPGAGAWTYFKALSLERGKPLAGVNVEECLNDIEEYGFHITDAHVRVTDKYLPV